jgi:hypothetical protein
MDTEAFEGLVAAAGFIFRGSVEHHWKGEAPAIPKDSGETVAVRIDHVLRSTAVLRGLAGQQAIVITRHADALRRSHSSILFTECISLGQQLLLREIGQVEASDDASRQVAAAIRAADERPLRERVAAAELIVVGVVTESRALERPFPPRSEHDPLWSLARVAVSAVLKGRKPRNDAKGRKQREEIEVLYASSDDRVWFHSPKLHAGVSGILLLFPVKRDEVPKDVPRTAYQATDPLDLLPLERRGEVERLLSDEHGGR